MWKPVNVSPGGLMKPVLLLLIFFGTVCAQAEGSYAFLSKVEGVKIHENNGTFRLLVSLKEPLRRRVGKPLLGGNYIQYTFTEAYVEPAKQIIRGSGTPVERIILYQYNRKTVRLRIFIDRKKLNRKMFDRISLVARDGKSLFIGTAFSEKIAGEKIISGSEVTEEDIKRQNPDLVAEIEKKAKTSREGKQSKLDKEESLGDFLKPKAGKEQTFMKSSSKGIGLSKMAYSLGLVIVLILVVAWLFRRFTFKGAKISVNNRAIEVMNREYIGAKSFLALVRVMDRYLLLGITGERISTLTEFSEVPGEFAKQLAVVDKKSHKLSVNMKEEKKRNTRPGKSAENIFRRTIRDASDKMVGVDEPGRVFPEPRGVIDDPSIGVITGMIKAKVKDLPRL